MQEHKPKYFQYVITAVIIVIAVIMIISFFDKEEVATLPESGVIMDEDSHVIEATNLDMEYLESWDFYENAIEDIQTLEEEQQISRGLVRDPINENIVYFATHTDPIETNETLISIYKYDESDYSFERIWKRTYAGDEETLIDFTPHWPKLRVVAYENNSLILLAQYVEDHPEFCSDYPFHLATEWENDGMRKLYSMDLENPYDGLSEFEPTEEMLESEKGWDTCADGEMIETVEIREAIEASQE